MALQLALALRNSIGQDRRQRGIQGGVSVLLPGSIEHSEPWCRKGFLGALVTRVDHCWTRGAATARLEKPLQLIKGRRLQRCCELVLQRRFVLRDGTREVAGHQQPYAPRREGAKQLGVPV